MTSKVRKKLHKAVVEKLEKEGQVKPMEEKDFWQISVELFRPNINEEIFEWGVIVFDMYESHTFCHFISPSKEEAERVAQEIKERLNNNEPVYWDCYDRGTRFHNSTRFGVYYS